MLYKGTGFNPAVGSSSGVNKEIDGMFSWVKLVALYNMQ
jgi:hypothetical protein